MRRPDLKLRGRSALGRGPEVRAPKVVSDLYEDLRDRRLLPLVVLLLVAIVAAPIFVGGSKKHAEPPVAATPRSAVDEASFSVVPAATELQSYKTRLAHRRSVNPFNPYTALGHHTPPREIRKAAVAIVEGARSGESGTTSPEAEVQPPASTGSVIAEPAPTTTVIEKPTVVKATIKAQVGVAAVINAGYVGSEPKSLEIENQTKLPPDNPAIVYTGTSKKGGALFLMTGQVTEFSGDGHCVLGGSLCQVVELKVKVSETFAIGYGETRYKVELLGFQPVVKEELIEKEGKKIRVPSREKGKGKSDGNGQGPTGAGPSPRLLLR
jgi:hypothetical protein